MPQTPATEQRAVDALAQLLRREVVERRLQLVVTRVGLCFVELAAAFADAADAAAVRDEMDLAVADEGDVAGERPGGFNFKAIAKYDAWADVKGKSREDAMREYVALVDSLR